MRLGSVADMSIPSKANMQLSGRAIDLLTFFGGAFVFYLSANLVLAALSRPVSVQSDLRAFGLSVIVGIVVMLVRIHVARQRTRERRGFEVVNGGSDVRESA